MGTFTLAEFAAFDSRSISPGLVSTILSQDGTPACPRAFPAQKHKTKSEEPVCKSPLIATALIALLGSVGTAAAGTMYDWNELSPPQADFMAQQRVDLNYAKGEAPFAVGALTVESFLSHGGPSGKTPRTSAATPRNRTAIRGWSLEDNADLGG
jgi:hypothetical protein